MTTRGRLEDHRRFVRLLHHGLSLGAFFDAADRALARLLQFDSACWLSLDPASLLPTSHFTREIDSGHCPAPMEWCWDRDMAPRATRALSGDGRGVVPRR